jgi:hypothetical protein
MASPVPGIPSNHAMSTSTGKRSRKENAPVCTRIPKREALARWQRFRAQLARGPSPDTDWIEPGPVPPAWVYVGSAAPKHILYLTKELVLHRLTEGFYRGFPSQVAVVVHPGVATSPHCSLISACATAWGSDVWFLGDLDPQDLAIYASLCLGGDPFTEHSASRLKVGYAGINDAWIETAESCFKDASWGGDGFLDVISTPLAIAEKRYLNAVLPLIPNHEVLLGRRCSELLMSGRKIETEALLNMTFFDRRYRRRVRSLLGIG